MLLSKNEKRFLIIGFISMMIVATFVDLPLTKALYDPLSPFGLFFKHFASFPGTLLGAMSFSVLTVTTPRNIKYLWHSRIINGILMIVFGFSLVDAPLLSMGVYQPLLAVFGVVFVLCVAYLVTKLTLEKQSRLRRFAIVGVITMVGSMVAANLIKIVWGRARYYTMIGNDAKFTPWFIPQGFTLSESMKSFPSGHSQFAAVSLLSTLLPDIFDALKGKRRLFLLASILWIVMVMASRMILGEHFLSDTLVGVAITVGIFAWAKKRYLKDLN
ncbi:MAG: phosphatase PAP2 family protein [Erysipelotrichaceae bacterium]